MHWYITVLKKYAEFNGRARRTEYWMFVLINFIIANGLDIIERFILRSNYDASMLSLVYQLAVIIPSIAVGVRRMHDVGKSGWFLLIPIYNLILAITEGDKGENEYGPDPKQEANTDTDTIDGHLLK